jgi:hypothetical protein
MPRTSEKRRAVRKLKKAIEQQLSATSTTLMAKSLG